MPEPIRPKLIAQMIVEDEYACNFEIDTDSDLVVITPEMFKRISRATKHKLYKRPKHTIITCDGTSTDKDCFTTYLTLAKADNPKKTKVFQTAVLDGPYILLG